MAAIIHVDMDAFFAAIEVLDRPELRGKPVVVGGPPDSRGVVSTASYEARRFGVRSAMSCREAYRLCPTAVFLPVRYWRYSELSRQVMEILRHEGGGRIEPMSIDEAYIDPGPADAIEIARRIKDRIAAETGLTASIGVAPNKLLAKIASDLGKPDGFTVIQPHEVAAILAPLPVRRLPGVGPRTAGELALLGIVTVQQLLTADRGLLNLSFGRRAAELLRLAAGEDDRPLEIVHEAKSLGTETTFDEDVADWTFLRRRLHDFAEELAGRLTASSLRAKTVTVKLRFADFQTLTRSQRVPGGVQQVEEIARAADKLLLKIERLDKVRLIGLQVAGLSDRPEPVQLHFDFIDPEREAEPRA